MLNTWHGIKRPGILPPDMQWIGQMGSKNALITPENLKIKKTTYLKMLKTQGRRRSSEATVVRTPGINSIFANLMQVSRLIKS